MVRERISTNLAARWFLDRVMSWVYTRLSNIEVEQAPGEHIKHPFLPDAETESIILRPTQTPLTPLTTPASAY